MRVCDLIQALQFQRSLDDVEQCVASVERELATEDCGSDLPSVNRLLKALQGLEEEVDGHRNRIQVQHATRVASCLNLSHDGSSLRVFVLLSVHTAPNGNSEEPSRSGELPG